MLKFLLIGMLSFQSLFVTLSALENTNTKTELQGPLQKFTEAINQGNSETLSTIWSEDAEFVNPVTEEVISGKNEIVQYLQNRIKELKERQLKFTFKPTKSEFPEENYAIIQGVAEIRDKEGALIQRHARQIELVKENGAWKIDSVSEIEVAPPPVNDHLKELGWLVGNWKDKDETVTITFKTEWDNINFIKQEFSMEVYGLDVMEGFQLVGWDPQNNKIRSWVFDSDGGFGTGLWSKKGDSWYVELDYTLGDGAKASATNIYTKVNDSSYKFSSIERKVNNEALPEIAPITVVKEE